MRYLDPNDAKNIIVNCMSSKLPKESVSRFIEHDGVIELSSPQIRPGTLTEREKILIESMVAILTQQLNELVAEFNRHKHTSYDGGITFT